MHDWTDRLSEYLDGELPPDDTAALERHLDGCDACRRALLELRDVVAAARALADHPPERDLWAGIADRIAAADALDIRPARPGRRFSFSMPQLAAAAVILMTLSGGSAVLLTRDAPVELASGTIVHSAGGGGSAQLASTPSATDAAVLADVDALELALAEDRDRLDPTTVEVVERSLGVIDAAIEDARTALAADPGNPYLHRQLDNTMRRKLSILRRATGVDRAGS